MAADGVPAVNPLGEGPEPEPHAEPPPTRGGGGSVGIPKAGVGLVSIPDLRDYHLINAELVQRLDAGFAHVRLVGAEGHRLLVSRLRGDWRAVVEVDGRAGPELAAELDAPGLRVVCRGTAADGAARGLAAGLVLILGDAGAGLGYAMTGGSVVVSGSTGPRAGLNMTGGDLVLLGAVGALAGERQAGGRIFAARSTVGPNAGHGRRGGVWVDLDEQTSRSGLDPILSRCQPWLDRPKVQWAPKHDGP